MNVCNITVHLKAVKMIHFMLVYLTIRILKLNKKLQAYKRHDINEKLQKQQTLDARTSDMEIARHRL